MTSSWYKAFLNGEDISAAYYKSMVIFQIIMIDDVLLLLSDRSLMREEKLCLYSDVMIQCSCNLGSLLFMHSSWCCKGMASPQRMTLNYAVIAGQIKFVLYDDRPNSSTKAAFLNYFFHLKTICLLQYHL